MQTYTVLMSKNNFDASKVSIGNLVYIYDSENLNRTLGFIPLEHKVRWIPLMKDTAPSFTGAEETGSIGGTTETGGAANTGGTENNTGTTTEMEVTDNGNGSKENTVPAGE